MRTLVTKYRSSLVALALMSAAGYAAADVAEIKWNEAGEAAQEFQIQPAKFAEWCTKLRSGEKVNWRFDAGAAVNFNIHYHEGKDVRFPAKQDGIANADGLLEVLEDQDYCWMWSNKTNAVVTLKATAAKAR